MRTYKLIFILIIVILTSAEGAFAQFGKSEPYVTSKVVLSSDKLKPGAAFELAIVATVKKGFHVGSHDKDAGYPASLKLTAPKGITLAEPVWPKAERKAFPIAPDEKIPVYEGKFVIKVKGKVAKNVKPGTITIVSKLEVQGCKDDQCYPPQTSDVKLKVEVAKPGEKVKSINKDIFAAAMLRGDHIPKPPAAGTSDDAGAMAGKLASAGIPLRLAMLFGLGLLLAFTPCVYPMIPITVGYFGSQVGSSNSKVMKLAGAYVLGLALTYSTLGAVAATTGGVFGSAMQSPMVIVGIAALLVLLSMSMFGLYELKPPAFVANRSSGKDGVLGALMMGLVFGIVAAPCVGPVVLGLLLYVANLGSPLMGFVLFFALALGLGTPLFALAAFSAKMPVPGMWMVAVKKIAGFLMLGAAAYFLKPILPDSIGNLLIPAIILAAAIYLGFMEKSLRSSKIVASLTRVGCVAALAAAVAMAMPSSQSVSIEWQPYKLNSIESSARSGKPAMLDFTAKWCGICKELERETFSDPEVIKMTRKFNTFRVDGTDRNNKTMLAAVEKYKVIGFPTVIFFDSSGREIKSARVVGFVNSKEMLKRIASVK
ncbi:MAG: protein-disulfide reductase DsbD [Armatimonadota bacterium]|nr:protein-disulfide reductase DsbD [bacterium]